jgi:hypothetical protein
LCRPSFGRRAHAQCEPGLIEGSCDARQHKVELFDGLALPEDRTTLVGQAPVLIDRAGHDDQRVVMLGDEGIGA